MKPYKFDGKQYQIPEKWEDVTVAMLIKAAELSELLDEAPIIAIISAYTGIPVKDLRLSLSSEVQEIIAIMSFISEPYEPKMATEFDFDGRHYACEDDLRKQKFEDFVSIQTALHNHRDEPTRALPKLLAIYCKQEGETLDDFDLDERSKEFEALPMTIAKDIEAFFLHSINAYRGIMWLSSTTDIQKELVLHKLDELQSTAKQFKGRTGMFSGTRLQIGVLQIYLWWARKVLVRYFNSIPTKLSKKTWNQTFKNWLMKIVKRKSNGNPNSKL